MSSLTKNLLICSAIAIIITAAILINSHQSTESSDLKLTADGSTSEYDFVEGWWTNSNMSSTVKGSLSSLLNILAKTDSNQGISSEDISKYTEDISATEEKTEIGKEKLEMAMSYVGRLNYDSDYHEAIFLENDGYNITRTDNSGFISNIWYDELGIKELGHNMTFDEIWEFAESNNLLKKVSDGGYTLGDVIIMKSPYQYLAIYAGTVNNEIWCVECTESNGGGIFFMSRGNNWYENCYYIDFT